MAFSLYVKCVCPSCFEEIFLGECRIVSGGTTGKELKPRSRGPFARMNVEPLDGPKYTKELACRECTACGYLLPFNIELVPSIMLVVVGDTFSGKSHYIASLIHQMKNDWIGNAAGFARLTCLTPDVEDTYFREYFEPLFTNRQTLPPTQQASQPYARPLIYKLATSPSPRHPPTAVNLMIYDTAGEDFISYRLVQFARFVLHTNAFIFVADPSTMPSIFRRLPAPLQSQLQPQFSFAQRRRTAESFGSIMDVIERFRRASGGARLPDTPVAVMLSKSDVFQHLSSPSSFTFMRNPPYGGDIDLKDLDAVDREVRGLLRDHQQGDLLATTSRFRQVKFFATSATGESPDASNQFTDVRPLRCPDPVLWILHRLGILRAS